MPSLLPNFTPYKPTQAPEAYPNQDWAAQSLRYEQWRRYYTGEVFQDVVAETQAPKYPVAVNMCKTIALLNAHAVMGDWDSDVFRWEAHSFADEEKPTKDGGLKYLEVVGRYSRLNSLYIRQIITHSAMGGAVFGIRYRPDLPTKAVWTAIPPQHFFPVFSALGSELLEVLVRFQISGIEAQSTYSVRTDAPTVGYEERWTKEGYTISVDHEVVRRGPAMGGVIPFVYIPRIREVGENYGEASFNDIMSLQDEVNLRVADLGDAINRETHKDVYVSNISGGAKSIRKHGRFIDLGMGLGNAKPEVHDVDRGAVPAGSFDMVNALIDFTRYSAHTPAVAFGEDEGSQRSSMTLVVRMWPMIQQAKANRAGIIDGLSELADKTFQIGKAAGVNIDTSHRHYAPSLPPLLPKDREQIVNEVSTLWNGGSNPLISPERALDRLDVPEDERAAELARLEELRQEAQALEKELVEMEIAIKREELSMKKEEMRVDLQVQREQMSLDRAKADQDMTIAKEKADTQISLAKRREKEMPKKKPANGGSKSTTNG